MWKKTEIKHRKGEGAKEVGIVKREYIAIEQGVRNKVKNDWWKFKQQLGIFWTKTFS